MKRKFSQIIRQIAREILPNFALRGIRYLIYRNEDPVQVREDISSLIETHNIKLKRESIVIGNGPSLKHSLQNNLGFFANKTIFCTNNFSSSEVFEIIKPHFCVFHDNDFWNINASPERQDYAIQVYEQLKVKVKWPMFILMPTWAREWNWFLGLPDENSNIVLAYYNSNQNGDAPEIRHSLYKQNMAMPNCNTVVHAATFLSLNLGCTTTYLMGADLSMHENIFVNDDNILCIYDRHFYDDKEISFVPFVKGEHTDVTYNAYETFLGYAHMHKGFMEIEEYARYLGSKIYNASHKSYIDAFARYKL